MQVIIMFYMQYNIIYMTDGRKNKSVKIGFMGINQLFFNVFFFNNKTLFYPETRDMHNSSKYIKYFNVSLYTAWTNIYCLLLILFYILFLHFASFFFSFVYYDMHLTVRQIWKYCGLLNKIIGFKWFELYFDDLFDYQVNFPLEKLLKKILKLIEVAC